MADGPHQAGFGKMFSCFDNGPYVYRDRKKLLMLFRSDALSAVDTHASCVMSFIFKDPRTLNETLVGLNTMNKCFDISKYIMTYQFKT